MDILELLGSSNFFSISKPLVKKIGLQTACLLQEIISKYKWHNKNTKDFENSYGLFWSQSHIAEDFGISIKTVQRELQKLKELGLIKINCKGSPARNYYQLNQENILLFLGDIKTGQKVLTCNDKKSQLDKTKSPIIILEEKELEKEENIKKTSNKFDSGDYIKSLDININLKTAFINWLEIRKIKKTVTSKTAIDLTIKKLEKWYPNKIDKQIECLENSILNGWTGVFELKITNFTQNKQNNSQKTFLGANTRQPEKNDKIDLTKPFVLNTGFEVIKK